MALEVECAGICPACKGWDALWRGVDALAAGGGTTYLYCDPPPLWLRARLDRWAA
jgi:hypothetical protein